MMKSFKSQSTNDEDGSGDGFEVFSMHDPSGAATNEDVLAVLRARGEINDISACQHSQELSCGLHFNPVGPVRRTVVDCGVLITVKQSYYFG